MRKVVDTNALQSTALRDYLAASCHNVAVLTEYASIELHKADTIENLIASLDVVSSFPEQVIILKGTQALCGLHGDGKGLQRRLIDTRSTRNFARYCAQLKRARGGDRGIQAQMLRRKADAGEISDRLLSAMPDVTEARKQVAAGYSNSELRIIRTHGVMSLELGEKFIRNVVWLAAFLFRNHPKVSERPDAETLANRYLFRYALCTHIWLLEWISHGSRDGSARNVRNDTIDLHFATCATYFDGLMSADGLPLRIYREAAAQLKFLAPTSRP